nr:ABC transporter permease subunit [Bacillus licheniformis]
MQSCWQPNSIALEHSKGTIKFAIATPVKRWHYLLGKYLSILLNTVFMFVATLLFAFVLGYALLGLEGSQYYLSYRSGEVIKMSMLKFLALDYGAALLNIIVLATLAFMISVILRSAVVSVGLSLFVFFTGSAITQFLAAKFDWTKYTIFANSDLSQYIDGEPFIQDMTLSFSAAVIAVYFILFLAVSFWVFQKRDIVTS